MTSMPTYHLDQFNGPLDLLLYLVQKDEVDICEIFLKELTKQFNENDIDLGAEFLGNTSLLLLMKSRRLLPKEEQVETTVEEQDFRYEMMQQLIEYYRLKNTAQTLATLEECASGHFPRKAQELLKREGVIAEVTIAELNALVQEIIRKAETLPKKLIDEEEFDVSSKIAWIEKMCAMQGSIPFEEVFSENRPKMELIVFFLATLELMKWQKIVILRKNEKLWIYESQSV